MGFSLSPLRAIFVVQGLTLGFIAWSVLEQRELSAQLHVALREFESIREEEIQLTKGNPYPNPGPGGNPIDPSNSPEIGQWSLGCWGQQYSTHLISIVVLLLTLLGLFVCGCLWQRAPVQLEEPRTPISPSAKQQLAQRQLAEVRLRRHGFGG